MNFRNQTHHFLLKKIDKRFYEDLSKFSRTQVFFVETHNGEF